MTIRTHQYTLALLAAACSPAPRLPPLVSAAGDMTWAGSKASLAPYAAELQVSAKGRIVAVDGVLPGSLCGQLGEPVFHRGPGVLALELVLVPSAPCPDPDSALVFTGTFMDVPPGTYTVWLMAPARAKQGAQARDAGVDTVRVGEVSVAAVAGT